MLFHRSAALALLALALMASCGRTRPAPLQVATNVWPGYEPLYLARQSGALDPVRVRLVEMSNSTDAMRALKAGLIQGAALTLDEALSLQQDGADLRIVLVLDESHGADVLLGGPRVGSLKELKGRRVGVEDSAVGAYLLSRALETAGMATHDIRVVPVTEDAHVDAYRTAAVDALVTFEPSRTRLLQEGARVLFDSGRIPQEIFDVLVVRTEALRRDPEAVDHLRDAWFRALDQVRRDPEASARSMAPREGLEPEPFRRALAGLRFPDREEERRLREGALLPPARRLAGIMRQNRLLKNLVDPERLLAAP